MPRGGQSHNITLHGCWAWGGQVTAEFSAHVCNSAHGMFANQHSGCFGESTVCVQALQKQCHSCLMRPLAVAAGCMHVSSAVTPNGAGTMHAGA